MLVITWIYYILAIEMYCVFYMIKICIYGKDRVAKITELCYNDIEYFAKTYQYYLVVLTGPGLVKLGTLQLQAEDLLKLQISFNSAWLRQASSSF